MELSIILQGWILLKFVNPIRLKAGGGELNFRQSWVPKQVYL